MNKIFQGGMETKLNTMDVKPLHPLIFMSLAMLSMVVGVRGDTGFEYPISKPGCPHKCGNVSIPYPFGTRKGCYHGQTFRIICNETSYNPPKAFLSGKGPVNVTRIDLLSGELQAWLYLAQQCYNMDGTVSDDESGFAWFSSPTYTVSPSKNKFTVVGCDAFAFIEGPKFSIGCKATCEEHEHITNGSCTGIGCCQVSIPRRTMGTEIDFFKSKYNRTDRWRPDRRCSYAFVAEDSAYNFSSLHFTSLAKEQKFPVILEWTIGNQTCKEAQQNMTNYACKAKLGYCYESDNSQGYRCNCSQGYQGNPYLHDGCHDINECRLYEPCYVKCFNTPGNYSCSSCPKGYEGDGRKDGIGCVPISSSDKKFLIVALGTSVSITALLLACAWLYWGLQKRKLIQLRKKRFQENGGITLQQVLSQHEREIDAFKIFSAEELKKATKNYDESRVLGRGGQGTVYKGELPDTTVVAIKKANAIDTSQVQQFVNEVVVLSQINHRNVVRLLGCCLETDVPMLVYEFITNRTLFDHIQKDHTPQMPWHTRIRIAADIAGAISYLHSAASIPIIHRDIKTTNILLDESYTAKVSDFGTSKFAPADRTSVTTLVQGTLGYLDPEYLCSSHLTEKSDVFSFGVVLVELLTGEKAFSFCRKDEERNLATYFVLSLKEDRLLEIVDENLTRQVSDRQLHEVAVIAARCLNVKGEDRPSMKEVAIELEGMSKREMHPWVEVNVNVDQETAVLLRGPLRSHSGSSQMTNLSVGR